MKNFVKTFCPTFLSIINHQQDFDYKLISHNYIIDAASIFSLFVSYFLKEIKTAMTQTHFDLQGKIGDRRCRARQK